MKTHYEILGIPPTSRAKRIQAAYDKKLAKKGDKEISKEIQAAYDILMDPIARKMYDAVIFAPTPPEPEYTKIEHILYRTSPEAKAITVALIVMFIIFAIVMDIIDWLW